MINYNICSDTCQIKNYNINIVINQNSTKNQSENEQNQSFDEWVNMNFKQKKEKTIKIQNAYKLAGINLKAHRIEECFTIAKFWQSKTEPDKIKLIYANSCRVRLCPSCAWRRSMKYYKENKLIFHQLEQKKLRYIFLTVTIKNCSPEELSETLSKITEGYHRLLKYKEVKKIAEGTIRSIEITYNKSTNTFHPHIHAIIAVKPSYFSYNYISQEKWRDMWAKACNIDYLPITDIRAFKQKTAKSIAEISKYVVKYSDILNMSEKEISKILPYLDKAIANRRMISYSGIFRKIRQALRLKDDLPDIEEEEPAEEGFIYLYKWHWGLNKYIQCEEEEFYQSTSEVQ